MKDRFLFYEFKRLFSIHYYCGEIYYFIMLYVNCSRNNTWTTWSTGPEIYRPTHSSAVHGTQVPSRPLPPTETGGKIPIDNRSLATERENPVQSFQNGKSNRCSRSLGIRPQKCLLQHSDSRRLSALPSLHLEGKGYTTLFRPSTSSQNIHKSDEAHLGKDAATGSEHSRLHRRFLDLPSEQRQVQRTDVSLNNKPPGITGVCDKPRK